METKDLTNAQAQLEVVMAGINRQFGAGSILKYGTDNIAPWPSFSTGALPLDQAIGIGGLPKGRIVEAYGPESSGKTTICLSVIAEAQRQGGVCAFIDAEHALDPQYARALGVNMDDLLLSQPDYGEMAIDILVALVKSGLLSVIVVDSVAALTPKAEIDGDMSDNHMGLLPRMMARAMRLLTAIASETNTLIIFTNQIREKIGIVYGNKETTPGGRALRFHASVRLEIRRIEDIKDGGDITGVRTKVKCVKNKMAPPFKTAEFDILYGRGINVVGCVLDLAVEAGLLHKGGAWYEISGDKYQGRPAAIAALASDMDLVYDLRKQILER